MGKNNSTRPPDVARSRAVRKTGAARRQLGQQCRTFHDLDGGTPHNPINCNPITTEIVAADRMALLSAAARLISPCYIEKSVCESVRIEPTEAGRNRNNFGYVILANAPILRMV